MEKMCNRCTTSKDISEFYKSHQFKDGRKPWCKQCFRDYYKERRDNSIQDVPIRDKISPYVFPGIKIFSNTEEDRIDKMADLLNALCNHYQIPVADALSKNRWPPFVYIRGMFCYIAKKRFRKISKMEISRFLDQDHTTVLNSLRKFQEKLDTNQETPHELRGTKRTYKLDYEHINKIL